MINAAKPVLKPVLVEPVVTEDDQVGQVDEVLTLTGVIEIAVGIPVRIGRCAHPACGEDGIIEQVHADRVDEVGDRDVAEEEPVQVGARAGCLSAAAIQEGDD